MLLLGAEALAQEKINYTLDWVPYAKHTGFYVGVGRGLYKAEGLDVTILRGYGSLNVAMTVAARSSQLGYTDATSVVIGRDKGLDLKLLASVNDRGFHALLMLKSSGITKPSDVEGKRIGVTVGDAIHAAWPLFTRATGLKNWTWVPMEPAAKNPSLLAKKVDAIASFSIVRVPLMDGAKKINDSIVTIEFNDHGIQIPSDGIVSTDTYIKEKPQAVRGFVKASLEAIAWSIEHPEEAIQILIKQLPDQNLEMSREFWKITMDHTLTPRMVANGLGYIDPGNMRYVRDAITEAYSLKKTIPVEDIYRTDFLPSPLPRARRAAGW